MSRRELTFVGLSEDGQSLIVADAKGSQYSIRLDPRISAALSDPHRPAQMEIPLQPLSPKDIQARIRAGATVEEICAESGEDIARVRRFEGPPLADRAFIAERARTCTLRGAATGDLTLEALVGARLDERGVTIEAAHWDSWRREDGRWTVIVAFPSGTSAERVATWVFDPEARHVTPDDDEAERMVDPAAAQTIRHLPTRKAAPGSKPRPSAVASTSEMSGSEEPGLFSAAAQNTVADDETDSTTDSIITEVITEVVAEVVDIVDITHTAAPDAPVGGQDVSDEQVRSAEHGVEQQPAAVEPPKPARKTRGKRASIPSWDEILFGGGKDDVS